MKQPRLQVICLGANGGPVESNLSSFVVRRIAEPSAEAEPLPIDSADSGSDDDQLNTMVAVDCGSHFGCFSTMLERTARTVYGDLKPPGRDARSFSQTGATRLPLIDLVPPTSQLAEYAREYALLCEKKTTGLMHENAVKLTRQKNRTYWKLRTEATKTAKDIILRRLRVFLITHAHLDHVASLVINSPMFSTTIPSTCCVEARAASQDECPASHTAKDGNSDRGRLPRPVIAGLANTLAGLRAHLFNDVIWPNLLDKPGLDFIRTITLSDHNIDHLHHHKTSTPGSNREVEIARRRSEVLYQPLSTGISVASFEISHGATCKVEQAQPSTGNSTAFFIRYNNLEQKYSPSREVLIFGDVEPDRISQNPRNKRVWRHAALMIALKRLRTIFIECSYDSSQPDNALFGHLSPKHVVNELIRLSSYLSKAKKHVAKKAKSYPKDSAAENRPAVDHGEGDQGSSRKRLMSPLTSPAAAGAPKRVRRTAAEGEREAAPGQSTTSQDRTGNGARPPSLMREAEETTKLLERHGMTGMGVDSIQDCQLLTLDPDMCMDFDSDQEREEKVARVEDPDADLSELTVYITHIKRDGSENEVGSDLESADERELEETLYGDVDEDYDPVAALIVKELYKLSRERGVACRFKAAKSGWGYDV